MDTLGASLLQTLGVLVWVHSGGVSAARHDSVRVWCLRCHRLTHMRLHDHDTFNIGLDPVNHNRRRLPPPPPPPPPPPSPSQPCGGRGKDIGGRRGGGKVGEEGTYYSENRRVLVNPQSP
ncbi:hypothetical protein CY34DRAFT_810583 [Suillus luteus UH-Slu-Lm8-n1]|uniref:Uncharacterized protein n=1 Tax=Suillus luteus UH-Slu-Lm8-n1 TaxID=930992 RepID=A0A0C9ZIF0_9AGAM|nr:hypothetical protein CY34DRAFT_810583 [Suillus luteus UH-Slu-Lm8-n1]